MILFSNIAFLAVSIGTGAIKEWRRYYPTLLYVALCNLLYNVLCLNNLVWSFHPQLLLTHKSADLVNTFVLLPMMTILYLHFFPENGKRARYYYTGWVLGFSALESVWYWSGAISYHGGWGLLWSLGFNFAMFFALRLHYKNVGWALWFSLFSTLFLIVVFHVSIWE